MYNFTLTACWGKNSFLIFIITDLESYNICLKASQLKEKKERLGLVEISEFSIICPCSENFYKNGSLSFFLSFFCFLGLHLQHMEVPRLGCQPTPQPQQRGIQAASMTYATQLVATLDSPTH